MIIRLDKLLAHSGYGTRKEVKQYIRKGYIFINGEICRDDDYKVDTENDEIIVGDEEIIFDEYIYIMMNKPKGYISATFDESKATVLDLLKENQTRGLFPVGRLDIDTTGLLVLTNDGKLAHKLLSPKHHAEKEYVLEYEGELAADSVERFAKGIDIDGEYITKPAKLILEGNHKARVIITEGKFHQIKRMIHACGAEVVELERVRMKDLYLDSTLELGEYRYLTEDEIKQLKS